MMSKNGLRTPKYVNEFSGCVMNERNYGFNMLAVLSGFVVKT